MIVYETYDEIMNIIEDNYQTLSDILTNIYNLLSINIDNKTMIYSIKEYISANFYNTRRFDSLLNFYFSKSKDVNNKYLNIPTKNVSVFYRIEYLSDECHTSYGTIHQPSFKHIELYKYTKYIDLRYKMYKYGYKDVYESIEEKCSKLLKEVTNFGKFLDDLLLKE